MTSTDFHVEAIDRLCFVCGCIIMKNGHHILLVCKEAMSLTFERSINLLENVTSSNMCHSCWTQSTRVSNRRFSSRSFLTCAEFLSLPCKPRRSDHIMFFPLGRNSPSKNYIQRNSYNFIYLNLPSSNWETPKMIRANIMYCKHKIYRSVNMLENTKRKRTRITALPEFLGPWNLFVVKDVG